MKITGRFCLMALASLSFIFTPSLSLGQFGSRPQAPKAQDGEKKEEASEETKAKFATANPEDITNEKRLQILTNHYFHDFYQEVK